MAKKDYSIKRPNTDTTVHLTSRFEVEGDGEKFNYTPTFGTVFRDEDLSYVKAYDVFFSDYLEHESFIEQIDTKGKRKVIWIGEPLLYYEHVGLYLDLYYAAERGERFDHDDLAARRKINPRTLRAMLDRLEDARLIIRVRDCSGKGHKVHVILCTPFSRDELKAQRGLLAARIQQEATRKEREAEGGKRRGRRSWPIVKWDVATIRKAIVVPNLANDLHMITKKIVQLIGEGHSTDVPEFYSEVGKLCQSEGVKISRKLFQTAQMFHHLRGYRKAPEPEPVN